MMYFAKLIRLPNLIIVALTQYLLQLVVRTSISPNPATKLVLNNLQFFIFVFATLCVTSAGYIINDIYDIEIDAQNKPLKKQIVSRKISKRNAFILYFLLTAFGGVLSVEIAYSIHHLEQLWLYPTFVFGLWLYAARLKKSFLTGNFFVASFCAAVAWIIYHAQMLNPSTQELLGSNFPYFEFIFMCYSVLAFISTFLREIIKDTEDAEGDSKFGAYTIPIVLGVKTTKIICYTLVALLIIATIFFGFVFNVVSFKFYLWQLTNLFSLYLGYLISKAQTKSDWHKAATVAKIVMLVGLVFVLLLL